MSASEPAVTIDMGASMETEEGLAIIDALNEVSDVQAMAGPEVTFLGRRRARWPPGGPGGGRPLRVPPGVADPAAGRTRGPALCGAGEALAEALDDLEEEDLHDAVREEASAAGLL